MPVLPLVGSALHRIRRVAAFNLAENHRLGAIRNTIETDQRSAADTQRIVFEDTQTQISQVCTWRFCRTVHARVSSANVVLSITLDTARSTCCHIAIHLLPHIGEGRSGFLAGTAFRRLRALDEAQYFSHGQRIGCARQQISSFAPRRDSTNPACLSPASQLEEFWWNLLTLGDFGDFDGLNGVLGGEIEDGLQGILAFDGDIHRGKQTPATY
jgi:hypothetical protein